MADEIPPPVVGPLLKSIADAFGLTPGGVGTVIGEILAPILVGMEDRIVDKILAGLKDTTEIGKPNEELQKSFPDDDPFAK